MADYIPALEVMIRNNGGYNLIQLNDGSGGASFAGITQAAQPNWQGWELLKHHSQISALKSLVNTYYAEQFWLPVGGDNIQSQRIASTLFGLAVKKGVEQAVKMAQLVVGQRADGVMNRQTVLKLNAMDAELFVLRFAMVKAQGQSDEAMLTTMPARMMARLTKPLGYSPRPAKPCVLQNTAMQMA